MFATALLSHFQFLRGFYDKVLQNFDYFRQIRQMESLVENLPFECQSFVQTSIGLMKLPFAIYSLSYLGVRTYF